MGGEGFLLQIEQLGEDLPQRSVADDVSRQLGLRGGEAVVGLEADADADLSGLASEEGYRDAGNSAGAQQGEHLFLQ